jgi:ribose transport system substrate-binding protein
LDRIGIVLIFGIVLPSISLHKLLTVSDTPPRVPRSLKHGIGRRFSQEGIVMKKALLIAGVLASLTAPVSQASAEETATVPVIVKAVTISFFQTLLAGARKAGKELGIKVTELGPDRMTDVASEISILENAVAQHPTAVVIAASDAKALAGPITEAAKSTIVIGVDSGADTDAFTAMVTTDNTQGGRIGADTLGEVLSKAGKTNGEIALLAIAPGNASLNQRASGFKEELGKKYPDLTVVVEKFGDGAPVSGLNIMTDVVTAHPDLIGVFCTDFIICTGAGQAIAENKLQEQIKTVTFDSDDVMLKYLSEGVIQALIVQDPFRMGYEGVKTAIAASKGEKVEKLIDTGVTVVTRENVDEPRVQELLHPKLD